MTISRVSAVMLLVLTIALPVGVEAETKRAAVFPFAFIDTSLEGSTEGPRPEEKARLEALDKQLHDSLAASGQYSIVDVGPVVDAARSQDLRSCGGCDVDLAKRVGAEVSVIGWVQKVSNLILNINLVVRDVGTGQPIRAGSVDIRGNTDESWQRGLAYLLKHRIFIEAPGAAQ